MYKWLSNKLNNMSDGVFAIFFFAALWLWTVSATYIGYVIFHCIHETEYTCVSCAISVIH